jgi:uncharacterized membrane protein YuzA (DUF378 family)
VCIEVMGPSGINLFCKYIDMNTKIVHIIAVTLVIVGGLNWGLMGGLNVDLVKWVGSSLNLPLLSTLIYLLVGTAALYLSIQRDVYLPFLNETVYPCAILTDKIPDAATIGAKVQVAPGAKVVYWASEGNKGENPREAYSGYNNSGVTTADVNGSALLRVRNPISYAIPSGRVLSRHIHYRYEVGPGMLSRVETLTL